MKVSKLFSVSCCILAVAQSYSAQDPQMVYAAQAGALPPQQLPSQDGQQEYIGPNLQVDPNQVSAALGSQVGGVPVAQVGQDGQDGQNDDATPVSNPVDDANNIFLENYVRKGVRFIADVYKKDASGRLFAQRLGGQDLQKAIVIFFGDWCPHCARFLGDFSRYMESLMAAGVKIWFVGVPSVERLQNWQMPTDADYQDALGKLNSFGIQLSRSAELVLLGNRETLNNNAIDSLPTMMAINGGKEVFRGGSDDSIQKVNLSDTGTMQQFLGIWKAPAIQKPKAAVKQNKQSSRTSSSCYTNGRVNREMADLYTELNNASGCGCMGAPVLYGDGVKKQTGTMSRNMRASQQKHLAMKKQSRVSFVQSIKAQNPRVLSLSKCGTRPLKERMAEGPTYSCNVDYDDD